MSRFFFFQSLLLKENVREKGPGVVFYVSANIGTASKYVFYDYGALARVDNGTNGIVKGSNYFFHFSSAVCSQLCIIPLYCHKMYIHKKA